jgi:hypothetical protein
MNTSELCLTRVPDLIKGLDPRRHFLGEIDHRVKPNNDE